MKKKKRKKKKAGNVDSQGTRSNGVASGVNISKEGRRIKPMDSRNLPRSTGEADQIRKRRLQNGRLSASCNHGAESPEFRRGLAKQRFSLGKGSSPTPREPGSGASP